MNDNLFRFAKDIQVRWRDLDALGHVNHATYLTYMEQGRIQYVGELGIDLQKPQDIGFIMAEVTCTYHSPISLSEQVTIRVRVTKLGRSSFTFEYRLEGKDGRVVATARTVQVCYDYRTESSIPIPERWRQLIIAYEPGLTEEEQA